MLIVDDVFWTANVSSSSYLLELINALLIADDVFWTAKVSPASYLLEPALYRDVGSQGTLKRRSLYFVNKQTHKYSINDDMYKYFETHTLISQLVKRSMFASES